MNIDSLKGKCRALVLVREELDKIKKTKTEFEKKKADLEGEIYEALVEHELKSFDSGFGKFTRVNKPYAKIMDKEKLTAYLKERGIYDNYITFNAATMNSFYKEELEVAKQEGNIDFNVPGMEVSSNRTGLSVSGVSLKTAMED